MEALECLEPLGWWFYMKLANFYLSNLLVDYIHTSDVLSPRHRGSLKPILVEMSVVHGVTIVRQIPRVGLQEVHKGLVCAITPSFKLEKKLKNRYTTRIPLY